MNAATPPSTLPYETPPAAPLDTARYRTAMFCGLAPLMTGLLTFLLWVLTGSEWLQIGGRFIIVCGLVLFAIGSSCLLGFLVEVWRQPRETRRHWWPSLSLAGFVLVVNFPVCYVLVVAVIHLTGWGKF